MKFLTSNKNPARGGVHLSGWVLTEPGTSASSVGPSYAYPERMWVLYTPCHNTRGTGVTHLMFPAGTSVRYLRPCHNAGNFLKFCNTFIPIPELLEVWKAPTRTLTWNPQTLHHITLRSLISQLECIVYFKVWIEWLKQLYLCTHRHQKGKYQTKTQAKTRIRAMRMVLYNQ